MGIIHEIKGMNPNSIRKLTQEEKEGNFTYRAGAVLNLPTLDKVNAYFLNTPRPTYPKSWVLNQGEYEAGNDECGGVSASRVLSLMNGYHVDPHFLWMMARQRAGDKITDYGISNVDLAKTMVAIGALKFEESPLSFKDGRDTIQDPTKWPPLQPLKLKAAEQACGSFIWVTPHNGMDSYDTYRATIMALNTLYNKPHGAIFGVLWNWPMSDVYIDVPSENGSGHDIPLYWETNNHLVAIQSYGLEAGNQGEQMISRAVFNKWAEDFGCFIPIDATRAQIDALIASGSKFNDPWRINIVRRFVDVYKSAKQPFSWLVAVLEMFLNNSKVGGVMLWDTPAHCRRNVRVMCDEAGLSYSLKNTICAIIKQESNWNPKAINKHNDNGTADHSLLQINDHVGYHIGKGLYFSSVADVYTHPEKQVQFIIQMAKAGKLNLWSSYKFGAYKKWLITESLPSVPY